MVEADLSFFHTEVNDVHAVTALLGGFILIFGFVSLIIKERLYLSESLVATLIGIAIGPVGIKILDPERWPGSTHRVTLYFTEIVIAIQVMAAAIALPKRFWREQWASLALLFGPVMIWMWLISALLMWLILRVSWAESLVLAACLAPTDPILANSIVTGRFADKYISVPIRNLLSGESAANDGLAIPFFELGLFLLSFSPQKAWSMWFYRIWLYDVGVAVLFGIVVGYLSKLALRASERRNYIDKRSFLSVEIALALFVLGLSSMLQLASFLAVFVTGLVFAWDGWFTEETVEAHVQEVVDNLINLTFFVYFGTIIPWDKFTAVHSIPMLILFWAALLVFRRLPCVLLLHHYLPRPALLTRREAYLVGHFGPIGVGAVWYICYAFEHQVVGEEAVTLVMWVVWCSVLVYGITAVLMHGLVRTMSVVRVYSGRSFNGRTLSFTGGPGVAAWPQNVPVGAGAISGPILSAADVANIHAGRGPQSPPGLALETVQTNSSNRLHNNLVTNSTETMTENGIPGGILVKSDPGGTPMFRTTTINSTTLANGATPLSPPAPPSVTIVTPEDCRNMGGAPFSRTDTNSSYSMLPLYRTRSRRASIDGSTISTTHSRHLKADDDEEDDFHDVIHISPPSPARNGDANYNNTGAAPPPPPPSSEEAGELGIPPGSVTECHDENGEQVLVGVGVRFRRFDTR
ncbi:hypothetical protein PhCBS80983_g06071 [Powellomyces hirtus]|uniref:Cation/H+ exchanger transmembrane domain-containing protein n=1 Tax=Powellomyces hirtus TaxID=109895 RepID=A0A507DRD5_9FUNG|nr:hypothetical protein PhCBS80983_g06071 [Powellomyces hirtus]